MEVPPIPPVRAVPAAPSVPTCLPDLPKGQALEKAKAAVKQKIEALAAKAPQTPVALPAAPGLPDSLPAAELAKLPVGKLPTCKGGENGKPVTPPHVPAPGLPQLPAGVSCDSVPQVIKNEEAKAKELNLPNGLQFGGSHAHQITIQSRAACVYTQELVGGLGNLITVERIKTPPQVTLQELAGSLKAAGSMATVNGLETWTSPANEGMLWYSEKGVAIRVFTTNPTAAALVPPIAAQLQTQ